MMEMKRCVFVFIWLTLVPIVFSASITTDQDSYSRGESAIIEGSGFSPNLDVIVQVNGPDDSVKFVSQVSSDGNGDFSVDYRIPSNGDLGTYTTYASDSTNVEQTSFSVATSPTTTITSDDNGGSGGSGGGGGDEWDGETDDGYEEKIWVVLRPGPHVSWLLSNENISIVRIDIDVKSELRVAKLKITDLQVRPSQTGQVTGKVYQYIEIIQENLNEDDLKETKITFRVDDDWISSGNIDGNSVNLNRWKDGEWEELETEFDKREGGYLYYETNTPGFSYFSVTGKGEEETTFIQSTTPKSHMTKTTSPQQRKKSKGDKFLFWMFAPFIVVILIILVILKIS